MLPTVFVCLGSAEFWFVSLCKYRLKCNRTQKALFSQSCVTIHLGSPSVRCVHGDYLCSPLYTLLKIAIRWLDIEAK